MADEKAAVDENQDWDIIYNEFERIAAMKQERRENPDNPFAATEKIEDFNLVKMRHAEIARVLQQNKVGGRLVMMTLSKTKRSDRYDVKADDIIHLAKLLKARSDQHEQEAVTLPSHLKAIQPIIHLTITKCAIDPLGIQQLSNLLLSHVSYRYLKRLNLNNIGLCYSKRNARGNNNKNSTTDNEQRLQALVYLAEGLRANRSLETLILDQNNRIPPEGLRIILFDGMLNHPTLDTLSYKSNKMNIFHMEVLSEFLQKSKNLEWLYLDRNSIDNAMMHELSQGLMVNSHVKAISLRTNYIQDDGIFHLSKVLKENKQCDIGLIDLYDNQLSSKSGLYLGEALAENYSLTKLYLSLNQIRDDGVIALCRGLKTNTSLWRLRLTKCGLTSKCCSALSNVLRTHCNMAELELEENQLVDDDKNGVVELAEGIAECKYLKFLNLTRTFPTKTGAEALAKGISEQVESVHTLKKDIKDCIVNSPILKQGNHDGTDILLPSEVVDMIVEQFAGFHRLKLLMYASNVKKFLDPETQPLARMQHSMLEKFGHQIKITW